LPDSAAIATGKTHGLRPGSRAWEIAAASAIDTETGVGPEATFRRDRAANPGEPCRLGGRAPRGARRAGFGPSVRRGVTDEVADLVVGGPRGRGTGGQTNPTAGPRFGGVQPAGEEVHRSEALPLGTDRWQGFGPDGGRRAADGIAGLARRPDPDTFCTLRRAGGSGRGGLATGRSGCRGSTLPELRQRQRTGRGGRGRGTGKRASRRQPGRTSVRQGPVGYRLVARGERPQQTGRQPGFGPGAGWRAAVEVLDRRTGTTVTRGCASAWPRGAGEPARRLAERQRDAAWQPDLGPAAARRSAAAVERPASQGSGTDAVPHFGGVGRTGRRPVRGRQERPWASHAADGFRPGCSGASAAVEEAAPSGWPERVTKPSFGAVAGRGKAGSSPEGAVVATDATHGLRSGRGGRSGHRGRRTGETTRTQPRPRFGVATEGRESERRPKERITGWTASRGLRLAARWTSRGRGAGTAGSRVFGWNCFGSDGRRQEARPTARSVRDGGKEATGASPGRPDRGPGAFGSGQRETRSVTSVTDPVERGQRPDVTSLPGNEVDFGRQRSWQGRHSEVVGAGTRADTIAEATGRRLDASSGLRPVSRGQVGSCGMKGERQHQEGNGHREVARLLERRML
jgi:hypothetical protein